MNVLTPLQERFVQQMLIDPTNHTEAYRKAGGKGKKGSSERKQATRLVAEGSVKAALEKARMERAERKKIDGDWVLGKLIENLERCMQSIPVYNPLTGEQTGEYQYDAKAANQALNMLMKHFGLYENDNRQKAGTEDLEALTAKLREQGVDFDRIKARLTTQPSAN